MSATVIVEVEVAAGTAECPEAKEIASESCKQVNVAAAKSVKKNSHEKGRGGREPRHR